MKAIKCCGDCQQYDWKKHKCKIAHDEGKPQDHFYADCPLPDVPAWISVKDRLPEVEKEVLILCNRNGHKIVTTAMYEDGTCTTEDSEWWWNEASDFCKYDEENDLYIIPEGWWEYKHFNTDDAYNNAVDIPVTHWMPLPEPPEAMP